VLTPLSDSGIVAIPAPALIYIYIYLVAADQNEPLNTVNSA
ncbi:MAG: hypothetical protein ACI945_000215, partial [Pseudohongiellaceae bacterium]